MPNAANAERVIGLLAERRAGRAHRDRPARAVRGHRGAGPEVAGGAAGAGAADRAGLRLLRRRRLRRPAGPGLPDRLHRRARLRADPGLGRRAAAVGRAGRDRPAARRHAGRPGRPGHPADRDGLPAARPGPDRADQPGAGRLDLGGGLEEGRASGAGRRCWPSGPPARPASCAACWSPTGACRAGTCRCSTAPAPPIGETTSGTFSPTLKQGIALALIDTGAERRRTATGCRSTSAAASWPPPWCRCRSSSRTSGKPALGESGRRDIRTSGGGRQSSRIVRQADIRLRKSTTRRPGAGGGAVDAGGNPVRAGTGRTRPVSRPLIRR